MSRKNKESRFKIFTSSTNPQPANVDHIPTLSNHGRTTRRHETIITKPSLTIDSTPSDVDVSLTGIGGSYDEPSMQPQIEVQEPGGIIVKVKPKAKRYENSDAPLTTWSKDFREQYVDALLWAEGRGRYQAKCANISCQAENPTFRCRDCFGRWAYCETCILRQHRTNPLHWIEEWDGRYFAKKPFKEHFKRFRLQLGHMSGFICPARSYVVEDFVVIDVNGIHQINLHFCGCPGAPSHSNQLIEFGWWPSTPKNPQTAATQNVLRNFLAHNYRGQITPTDYYKGLEELTCAKGLTDLPDRLSQWMIMIRKWRHCKMLKQMGRGHNPEGIKATALGELTMPCRQCPSPGINLPIDWESAPAHIKWLYALFLAEDANFKQKSRLRSGKHDEEALGPGWGVFVSNKPYLEYVSQFANQEEISHCVGFSAMWDSNRKRTKGLRATGIGAVVCARHGLYRPNGMGDLQVGERYCNMDYLFLSSIAYTAMLAISISYDIACQWCINFLLRLNRDTTPEHLRASVLKNITFLVPKFHLEAHTTKCHAPYSFNYAVGSARTDGESVERSWSLLNGFARSLSQMTPGGRSDTMDAFCNSFNWRNTTKTPSIMLRKMTKAIPQAIIHHRALSAFTESLQKEHGDNLVNDWEAQVKRWENDHKEKCPYDLPELKTSFAEVKRQLTIEEHDKTVKGEIVISFEGLSPADFIVVGLDLEHAQQDLVLKAKKTNRTTLQETEVIHKRTRLLKRIQDFVAVRACYLPGLANFLAASQTSNTSATKAEDTPLHLPSSIPADKHSSVCIGDVDKIEERFREGQATEALTQLRLQLAKRSCAFRYQCQNADSQRSYTRFRALQDQTNEKIKESQLRYTVARAALLSLRGPGEWEKTLQVLRREDIRGLGERALMTEERENENRMWKLAGVGKHIVSMDTICSIAQEPLPPTEFVPNLARGEGTRTLSWIWYSTSGEELENSSTKAYLRVEWLRCRARAARWKEEVQLLEEEMRRSIEYCRWKASWWEEQANRRARVTPSMLPHVAEGIAAYAFEQADDEREREKQWEEKWSDIRKHTALILETFLGEKESDSVSSLNITIEDEYESDVDTDEEGGVVLSD